MLPEKDKKICQKCIEERDFERLFEIVESFEIKVRELSDMVEKYANANLILDAEDDEDVIVRQDYSGFYNEDFNI